ncbi:hypothetical protein D3C78_1560010 [compost metagenome]
MTQIQRNHAVIFVVTVDTRTRRQRQHLIAAIEHAIHHFSEGFLICGLSGPQTLIKRCQFTQRNGDSFLLSDHVQPVLNRITRLKILNLMIHQPGGIHAVLHL